LLVSIDPPSEDQHQKLQRQSIHQTEPRPAKFEETGQYQRSSTRLSI
jgi:hypothetical protein